MSDSLGNLIVCARPGIWWFFSYSNLNGGLSKQTDNNVDVGRWFKSSHNSKLSVSRRSFKRTSRETNYTIKWHTRGLLIFHDSITPPTAKTCRFGGLGGSIYCASANLAPRYGRPEDALRKMQGTPGNLTAREGLRACPRTGVQGAKTMNATRYATQKRNAPYSERGGVCIQAIIGRSLWVYAIHLSRGRRVS